MQVGRRIDSAATAGRATGFHSHFDGGFFISYCWRSGQWRF
jgi:hypothetical protein